MKTIEFNNLYCKDLDYDIWYVKYSGSMVYKSSINAIFTLGFNTIFRK